MTEMGGKRTLERDVRLTPPNTANPQCVCLTSDGFKWHRLHEALWGIPNREGRKVETLDVTLSFNQPSSCIAPVSP